MMEKGAEDVASSGVGVGGAQYPLLDETFKSTVQPMNLMDPMQIAKNKYQLLTLKN